MPYPIASVMGAVGSRAARAGAVAPWYKPDGVNTSPLAAWRWKGAASYAASKINLVTPGTYDLIDTGHVPAWAAELGCTMSKNGSVALSWFDTGLTLANKNYTIIASFNAPMDGYNCFWGCFNTPYPTNTFAFARDNPSNQMQALLGNAANMQYYANSNALAFQDHVWAININGIYLDGVLSTSAGTPGNPAPDDETFAIGTAHYTAGGGTFTYGSSDGVIFHAMAIYPALLSLSEIGAVTNEIKKF